MQTEDNGLLTYTTPHTVDEVVASLTAIFTAKGITLFALVDHSGEAAKVGLTMPPTKLLIFGNPIAGTPLMLAAPSVAIDLPLKILIAQNENGVTQLTCNNPAWLGARHHLPEELLKNIAIDALIVKVS